MTLSRWRVLRMWSTPCQWSCSNKNSLSLVPLWVSFLWEVSLFSPVTVRMCSSFPVKIYRWPKYSSQTRVVKAVSDFLVNTSIPVSSGQLWLQCVSISPVMFWRRPLLSVALDLILSASSQPTPHLHWSFQSRPGGLLTCSITIYMLQFWLRTRCSATREAARLLYEPFKYLPVFSDVRRLSAMELYQHFLKIHHRCFACEPWDSEQGKAGKPEYLWS